MKTLQITIGMLAAGLGAAFLAGANWARNADVDAADYILSGDAIAIFGVVAGALFLLLAARLLYTAVRPSRGEPRPPVEPGPRAG